MHPNKCQHLTLHYPLFSNLGTCLRRCPAAKTTGCVCARACVCVCVITDVVLPRFGP